MTAYVAPKADFIETDIQWPNESTNGWSVDEHLYI